MGWNRPILALLRPCSATLAEPECADATCLVDWFTSTNELHERVYAPYGLAVLVWSVFWGVGLYAQVHRYRHVSGPVQRQQTKWVALALGLIFLFVLLGLFTPMLFVDTTSTWFVWALPVLMPMFRLFPRIGRSRDPAPPPVRH